MGYCTSFELKVEGGEASRIIKDFREGNENAASALQWNGSKNQGIQWYDYIDDLCEFSKKYPEVLFTLSGKGEDGGDVWKLYVKNGRSQMAIAEISFAEYDPELME